MSKNSKLLEKFYLQIDDEFEGRACKDISDDACQVVPNNFGLMLGAQIASKLGDLLASAKIVLTWLVASTGAPTYLISALVPIRESGSLLPQLFLGIKIRQHPVRKKFLVLGATIQGAAALGLMLVAFYLKGMAAGVSILLLLAVFSLARSVSSIASKDVIGKTIPKKKRGRQSGLASTVAGAASILIGLSLILGFQMNSGVFGLLLLGGACFGLSGLIYSFVKEYPGATEGGVNGFKGALENLALLKTDKPFAIFVGVRALMMSSSLAAPYFVLLTQRGDGSLKNLGLLIALSGLASFISSAIWGRMADQNSKRLMRLTSLLTACLCLTGAFVAWRWSDQPSWIHLSLFFMLSIVHEGVRQGRKIYLIDMAGGTKRTDYVSVSNTVIGLLLLFSGVIVGVLSRYSIATALFIFAAASLLALVVSQNMKEVSEETH